MRADSALYMQAETVHVTTDTAHTSLPMGKLYNKPQALESALNNRLYVAAGYILSVHAP